MTCIRLTDFDYLDWFSTHHVLIGGYVCPHDSTEDYRLSYCYNGYLRGNHYGYLTISNSCGREVAFGKIRMDSYYLNGMRTLSPNVRYKLSKEEAQDLFGLIEISGL